jgi:hypothetical protein
MKKRTIIYVYQAMAHVPESNPNLFKRDYGWVPEDDIILEEPKTHEPFVRGLLLSIKKAIKDQAADPDNFIIHNFPLTGNDPLRSTQENIRSNGQIAMDQSFRLPFSQTQYREITIQAKRNGLKVK